MEHIDTLTAYVLRFSFMERNNPLLTDQRESIRSGKAPDYTFSNFIEDYTEYAKGLAIGESTERGILLSNDRVSFCQIYDDIKRWHLCPRAGKQGKPVTVYKVSAAKEYNYGSDSAALYEHNIFIYENNDKIVAIFHRQNGSGCKSVFLETVNKMLKTKGYKLEMDLYIPNQQLQMEIIPSKITLQYIQNHQTSDIADNVKRRKKEIVIRDLGLNLEVAENSTIKRILADYQMGKVEKDKAFTQIKNECNAGEDYNEAEIQLRIGNRKKTVHWNEVEGAIGGYDISISFKSPENQKRPFIDVLIEESDKYYHIINSEMEEDDICPNSCG